MIRLTPRMLWSLLGEDAPPTDVGRVEVQLEQSHDGMTLQRLRILSGRRSVPTLVLLPPASVPRRGVLVYCHAHGHRYDLGKQEIIDGRPALLDPPLGMALAREGHVVICPDMPGFCDRAAEGTESALAKALHWHGQTLLGQMLMDLCLVLATRSRIPGVHDAPCGVVGFSMGAFLSFWLAALRPEIAACAHMCGFASMSGLIAAGGHDLHAPYLTVPGLLRHADFPDVAAMIAPRPQLVAAGLHDPLTPPAAFETALAQLRQAYGPNPALTVVVEAGEGHKETPGMRAEVVDFFNRALA